MSLAPATVQQTAYMQAAAIADKVLAAGVPLIGFDTYDDLLIFRFGEPRPQTVHMQADAASPTEAAAKLVAAYQAFPP